MTQHNTNASSTEVTPPLLTEEKHSWFLRKPWPVSHRYGPGKYRDQRERGHLYDELSQWHDHSEDTRWHAGGFRSHLRYHARDCDCT